MPATPAVSPRCWWRIQEYSAAREMFCCTATQRTRVAKTLAQAAGDQDKAAEGELGRAEPLHFKELWAAHRELFACRH